MIAGLEPPAGIGKNRIKRNATYCDNIANPPISFSFHDSNIYIAGKGRKNYLANFYVLILP